MHVRVRLHEPVSDSSQQQQITLNDWGNDSVWQAYVADAHNEKCRRAHRLFNDKEEAIEHLEMVAGCEDLTPVPVLDDVWCDYSEYEAEYAVLRREPIFEQADAPWS